MFSVLTEISKVVESSISFTSLIHVHFNNKNTIILKRYEPLIEISWPRMLHWGNDENVNICLK